MRPANPETAGHQPTVVSRLQFGDLVPIAVAVAAGCEDCARSLVKRALERGTSKSLVRRTLAIVADLRSRDCFARAVGSEVIARMAAALEGGEKALAMRDASGLECCPRKGGRKDAS